MTNKQATGKAALRSLALKSNKGFTSCEFEYEGAKYGVKALTIKEQLELTAKVSKTSDNETASTAAWRMIMQIYDVESGENVFEDLDYNSLINLRENDPFIKKFSDSIDYLSQSIQSEVEDLGKS